MKDSNKKSSGVEETKNQEGSKDNEELAPSNQDQPESALQNLVETGETGGPIKKVTGYATLKDLAMLARVNKKFQSAMNKEIKQRELFIHSVSVGREHTMLLVKTKQGQNKLYACGKNNYGQLGLGDDKDRHQWTEVNIPQGFKLEQVTAGEYHSFLIGKGKDGEDMIYATGHNSEGQLGLGDTANRHEWAEVSFPKGFKLEQVIAGDAQSYLKGKDKNGQDKLYACGNNNLRQLGLGEETFIDQWTRATLPEGFKLEQVVAGGVHTFLKGKGVNGEDKLFATGKNDDGQLGLGDTTNRTEFTEVPLRNILLKSLVSKEEASMNKKRSGGK